MLAGTGFGNHAGLAHASRQQRLADAVVDLVGAGVVEVFAFEEYLRAAEETRPAPGVIDRAGATDIVLEFVLEFGAKFRIGLRRRVGFAQFGQCRHQRLGDKNTAVGAEVAARVGQVIGKVLHLHLALRQ